MNAATEHTYTVDVIVDGVYHSTHTVTATREGQATTRAIAAALRGGLSLHGAFVTYTTTRHERSN